MASWCDFNLRIYHSQDHWTCRTGFCCCRCVTSCNYDMTSSDTVRTAYSVIIDHADENHWSMLKIYVRGTQLEVRSGDIVLRETSWIVPYDVWTHIVVSVRPLYQYLSSPCSMARRVCCIVWFSCLLAPIAVVVPPANNV